MSNGFKYAGRGLGAYNALSILNQYNNNEISTSQLITEQSSNLYSTLGGAYGAAWGVGWEAGRWITYREFYQSWKRETWMPWRKENFGY